ncbi:hypothetical protein EC988_001361 [Linderina pennispora]|nr:hypothetical protein EC988_001361 [Linderina pennispora]
MLSKFLATHTRVLFRQSPRIPLAAQNTRTLARAYSSEPADLDKEIEAITDLAMTAKDEMDFAEESRNSVYYNDDKQAAHEAVEELTNAYSQLLARLDDASSQAVQARIGMRIKEIQSAYEIMTLNDLED